MAYYTSEIDDAYSEDPPGEIIAAIECSRPKSAVAWVNIIASHCEWRLQSSGSVTPAVSRDLKENSLAYGRIGIKRRQREVWGCPSRPRTPNV